MGGGEGCQACCGPYCQAGGSQAGPACRGLHLSDHLEATAPLAFVGIVMAEARGATGLGTGGAMRVDTLLPLLVESQLPLWHSKRMVLLSFALLHPGAWRGAMLGSRDGCRVSRWS